MRYELQHIDDCPNWELAHERLREALIATGHTDDPVSVRTVRDPDEAERMGFAGPDGSHEPTLKAIRLALVADDHLIANERVINRFSFPSGPLI